MTITDRQHAVQTADRRRARWCALAYANFPHWSDVVIRCTPRESRARAWEEMAREALQQAEWAGNPWFLVDPLSDATMIDVSELEERWSPIEEPHGTSKTL
jgi:hypothetical protein